MYILLTHMPTHSLACNLPSPSSPGMEGSICHPLPETHFFLAQLRTFLSSSNMLSGLLYEKEKLGEKA